MSQAPAFGAARPIIPAGTQLNGIYEIDEPIAAGGMGEIYKGHAIQTGDPVAIKLIRSDLAEAEAAFALFRKEASALHNLYHEAIVRYYVFTIDPVLGRPYLAMEYVDGQSLSAMLRGGPLAFEAALRLVQRIAAGLSAAHERGIVHRDVSPDNIIIPGGDMGRAKIIDFGIARSTRLEDEGTVIGAGFAGKYNYVSPEQLGLHGGRITPKSDIYSLGLVLAEALRGTPIDMGGNHVDVIEKRRAVPELGAVDARLRPLIERMLEPDPADRPASMAEVAAFRADMPAAPRPRPKPAVRTPAQSLGPPRRGLTFGRLTAGLAGLALIGLAAGAPAIYRALRPAPAAPAPAPALQDEAGPAASAPAPQIAPQVAPALPASGPGLAPMEMASVEPELPAVPPGDAASLAARKTALAALARSLADYDGGDCFYARAVELADGALAVEGFGASTAPFRALDAALARPGSEADIGMRQVAAPQCAALDFLDDLRRSGAPPVRLELAAAAARAGETLAGSLKGADGREASALVVGADGLARLAALTREAEGDSYRLSIPAGADGAAPGLALVVAVVSPKPLTSLRIGAAGAPAARLFPQIMAEAERGGFAVAADLRSFRLDR